MERITKTFKIIYLTSTFVTFTAAIASIAGIIITGFYPGILVLLLLTLIPIMSNLYSKKITNKSNKFQRNYYTTTIILNTLTILLVFGMTFVILVDRVFSKIL